VDDEGTVRSMINGTCADHILYFLQKYRIKDKKAAADKIIMMEKKKKEQAKKNEHQKKIKKNMGLIRYYLCPCWRHYFDPALKNQLTEAERRAREEAIAKAKREAELRAKNPVTASWVKMEAKMEKLGEEKFAEMIIEKHVKTETFRDMRAGNRHQRKKQRERDNDLQHHFASTVNRIDV
jgi:hypothetical protein